MKLHIKENKSIPIFDMKDGQIGVITEWEANSKHIGLIVQRYRDVLIVLGGKPIQCFTTVLGSKCEEYRVEIIPNGTLLEITNN